MKTIVLIGLMGCGKTTIAKSLSRDLNRPWLDMDDVLVEKYQMSIPEMFAISEEDFRDKEALCCQDIGQLEGYVISTGGGVIQRQDNVLALKNKGVLFYIDRPVDKILEDINVETRPLLKDNPQRLKQLYQQRHAHYVQACDYHIYNAGSLADVLLQIKTIIINNSL